MSTLRRSTRTRSKPSTITDLGSDDDSSNESGVLSTVQQDDRTVMTDLSDEESSSDVDNNDDDDYEDPSTAKKSKKRKAPVRTKTSRSNIRPVKKAKKQAETNLTVNKPPSNTGTRKEQEEYLEVIKDFEPTELFDILANDENVSIEEIIRNYLDGYIENRATFIAEFINFLLCCCGAVVRVEEHDVSNNETANETISELQMMFQQQKIHEAFLLVSKNNKRRSKYKPLYQNFVEFMSKLIQIANDMQLLFTESEDSDSEIGPNQFVIDLLTWLSSLSVSKIRCLRQIATSCLYLLQDSLTEYIVEIEKNYLSKLTKQLTQEKKRKRPSEKTIERLEESVTELQANQQVIEGVIDNIIKLCFLHRFKDVDENIRGESVLHLSVWINNYPEFFLKVTYLKYFGWLLSDSSVYVRQQVLKTLPQLIASQNNKTNSNSSIRQFFERFKEKILSIALHDVDLEVRLYSINVFVEVSSLGYLEDLEILQISSLIYYDEEVKVQSHAKSSRFLAAVAKFFGRVLIEKNSEFSSNYVLEDEIFGLNSESLVKAGNLVGLLNKSLSYHFQNNENPSSKLKLKKLFQAAEFLHPYFGTLIEDICKLLTYKDDISYDFLNIEDEEEDTIIKKEFILPVDTKSIVLYSTTLNGLCHGVSVQQGQAKFRVAEEVLPFFETLLSQLPIHIADILIPLLSIFNLFKFEEWIHSGCEKNMSNILSKVMRTFNEMDISLKHDDLVTKWFAKTFELVKEMDITNLNDILINEVSSLMLHLQKFLTDKLDPSDYDSDFNELTTILYETYLNKLVLLGRSYSIELDSDFLKLFMENFISRLPIIFEYLNQETISVINFKFLTQFVTWNLQTWTDTIKNSLSTSHNTVGVPKDKIMMIASIIERLNTILVSSGHTRSGEIEESVKKFLLHWNICNALADIVSTLKVFEYSLPDNLKLWKEAFEDNFPYFLQEGASKCFTDVYIFLESITAKSLDIYIDRLAGEDININEVSLENVISLPESEFLLFTIKLKGLIKLKLISNQVEERLQINKEKFGSLYEKIVDNSIFERDQQNDIIHEENATHQTKATLVSSSSAGDEFDPIENPTQEEEVANAIVTNTNDDDIADDVDDISMMDNDHIETSEI
ncbi:hypothetical protein TPHA_0C01390 [Tetrapisispora phaffii CBS 4417]|uniref:SCD domain-containing protein n=1 Tax=Tetrapisispora phaffii (strain ATCC 24235 / CBS 4417 / NBRC 1672 / NRRL Y-8282 / UCD 70-5) TaxID=1071381 RepID=G8BRB9_TETPH|nr:hypothetical protein TPHA_0C01390 [Tetrapisispora phaffii CBS 4417]CCE62295.1 hypothetical protein TPHA_0C01390 [Tetrapisispora phaffii CBS 4417]